MESYRQRDALRYSPALKERIADWWGCNPFPGGELFCAQRKEWYSKWKQAFPELVVTTNLDQSLHFLIACEWFPQKHWLKVPSKERKRIGKTFYPVIPLTYSLFDPRRGEATPLLIQRLKEFLTSGWISTPSGESGLLEAAVLETSYVFSPHWQRSNTKLVGDFKKWLEMMRPPDQPGLESTKQSPSKRTGSRDRLKWLSALRLLRSFGGSAQEARFFYAEKSGTDDLLYGDDSTWRKAEVKARAEIRHFDHLAG